MGHERGFGATAVLAFLGGAALGVVAALLLAPQSGRKTREQLRGFARKAEDTLREAANEAGQKFEEAVSEGEEIGPARSLRGRPGRDETGARAGANRWLRG